MIPAAWRNDRRFARVGLALIGVALAIMPFAFALAGQAWVRVLNFGLLYIMLALGLNIVVGFAGLLDLGYIAFYAVGAYVYALLASLLIGAMGWHGAYLALGALAAIAGAGLTRVMSYKMDTAKRAGTLELVLENFECRRMNGVQQAHPAREILSTRGIT